MGDLKLRKAIRDAIQRATKPRVWPATLVGAGTRTGYSHVKFSNGLEMEVLNLRLANIANLKVRVGYDPIAPGELQVLGIREQMSFVGAVNDIVQWVVDHHQNHEFPNHDTVWVRDAQFLPLLALPTGSGFGVKIYGGAITGQTGYIWISDQTIDLAAYQPATGALWALLQVSRTDGVLGVKVGTTKAVKGALTIADVPSPDSGYKALCAVQLYDGQTTLQRDPRRGKVNDFLDLRWAELSSTSGGGTGGAFQRVLAGDLTLADGECLVLTGYIDVASYALTLNGDARLEIL